VDLGTRDTPPTLKLLKALRTVDLREGDLRKGLNRLEIVKGCEFEVRRNSRSSPTAKFPAGGSRRPPKGRRVNFGAKGRREEGESGKVDVRKDIGVGRHQRGESDPLGAPITGRGENYASPRGDWFRVAGGGGWEKQLRAKGRDGVAIVWRGPPVVILGQYGIVERGKQGENAWKQVCGRQSTVGSSEPGAGTWHGN